MKYHNHRIDTPDGKFDSKHEYERWCELKLLHRANKIADLRRQVKFLLIPPQKDADNKYIRAVYYIADFTYFKKGEYIVEDAKGFKTPEYKLKKKLMLYKYNITIFET